MATKRLKCVHCGEIFGQWMLYHMHLELHRLEAKGVVKETETLTEPVIKSKRCLVGVKQPLSDYNKAAAVKRGEERVGAINFIGEGC